MRRIITVIFLCVIVLLSPASFAKKHFVITHGQQVISKGWTHFEGGGRNLTLINDAMLIQPRSHTHKKRVIFIRVRHFSQYTPAGPSCTLTDQVVELTLSTRAGLEVQSCDVTPEQLRFPRKKEFVFSEYVSWLDRDNPTIVAYWINHIKDRSRHSDYWYPDEDLYDFVYFSIKNKRATLHDFEDLQQGAIKAITNNKTFTEWKGFIPCFAATPRQVRMDVRKSLQIPEGDSVFDAVELTQFHASGAGNSLLTIYFSRRHNAQLFSYATNSGDVLCVKGVSEATHKKIKLDESHRLQNSVLKLLLSPILQETLLHKTFPLAT
ncbi:hypothetical protein ACWJJH_07595 [Endozoicomonadaceae bacterium StTr2]